MSSDVERWLARDPDPRTREELRGLEASGELDELARRFAGRLEFGTAGLRGIVGAGPMRMNRLVVRETSAGLGRYLLDTQSGAADRGIVVTYDARPDSHQFARDAACVFLGLGFRVYFTTEPQPTPLGAFGVLRHRAAAGIVITASHNPPAYNGYKVYWENGAQILSPHDREIAARALQASNRDIPWETFDDAVNAGRVALLGPDFLSDYRARIAALDVLRKPRRHRGIRVAYTPLHGVGGNAARSLLEETGVCDVEVVASQFEPDGSFPTVDFPNPEEPGAMDAVIALAGDCGAELACANDPDADRLAVAVRSGTGEYEALTGDQVGVLLGHYLLGMPRDYEPILCTTIVSSRMLGAIAADAGASFYETLTGFKWLANVGMQHERDGRRFLFAYEEALGYAIGSLVRDKDGLSALLAFVQMTAELAADGKSPLDQLEFLYRKYGLYLTAQRSILLESPDTDVTRRVLSAPPAAIGDRAIVSTMNLREGKHTFADGRTVPLDFAPSDVMICFLDDRSRVIVRPSGTEPKIKCYYELVRTIEPGAEFGEAREAAQRQLLELISHHQASMPA